jgi:hypothetical protein
MHSLKRHKDAQAHQTVHIKQRTKTRMKTIPSPSITMANRWYHNIQYDNVFGVETHLKLMILRREYGRNSKPEEPA